MAQDVAGFLAAVLGSYLIGSFPTGYVVVKWLRRVDVRAVGSGNVGATNVTRVAGKGAGRLVFLIDGGKGVLAALVLAPWLLSPVTPTLQLGCGLVAVLGHSFPVFLRFQGGKGVATTLGVIAAVTPLAGLIVTLVWLAVFALSHYVSLASLALAAVIPPAQWALGRPAAELAVGGMLSLLVVVRHHENIRRLLERRERRAPRQAPLSGQ